MRFWMCTSITCFLCCCDPESRTWLRSIWIISLDVGIHERWCTSTWYPFQPLAPHYGRCRDWYITIERRHARVLTWFQIWSRHPLVSMQTVIFEFVACWSRAEMLFAWVAAITSTQKSDSQQEWDSFWSILWRIDMFFLPIDGLLSSSSTAACSCYSQLGKSNMCSIWLRVPSTFHLNHNKHWLKECVCYEIMHHCRSK